MEGCQRLANCCVSDGSVMLYNLKFSGILCYLVHTFFSFFHYNHTSVYINFVNFGL